MMLLPSKGKTTVSCVGCRAQVPAAATHVDVDDMPSRYCKACHRKLAGRQRDDMTRAEVQRIIRG